VQALFVLATVDSGFVLASFIGKGASIVWQHNRRFASTYPMYFS